MVIILCSKIKLIQFVDNIPKFISLVLFYGYFYFLYNLPFSAFNLMFSLSISLHLPLLA